MTFNAKQEAVAIVGETEFFEFDLGTHLEYYTSNRLKTVAFGRTWLPLPVKRSGFDKNQNPDPQRLRLLMPVRPSFISLVTQSGLDKIKLTIIRGFGRDYVNDYRNPWWVGWLKDITVGVTTLSGNLETVEGFFDDPYPKVRHQAGCNNTLFDETCGLNPASFMIVRTVTALASEGRIVTLSGAIPANDYYTFGQMRKAGSGLLWRQITQQAGPSYVLHVPILGLVVGDNVDVLPGCDRNCPTCINKFNNKPNFVGMPLIPVVNPVVDGF